MKVRAHKHQTLAFAACLACFSEQQRANVGNCCACGKPDHQTRVLAGDYVDDQMEGQGRYVYGNGDMYQGQFAAGKRHGTGVYHYKVCGTQLMHVLCRLCRHGNSSTYTNTCTAAPCTGIRLPAGGRLGGRSLCQGPLDPEGRVNLLRNIQPRIDTTAGSSLLCADTAAAAGAVQCQRPVGGRGAAGWRARPAGQAGRVVHSVCAAHPGFLALSVDMRLRRHALAALTFQDMTFQDI